MNGLLGEFRHPLQDIIPRASNVDHQLRMTDLGAEVRFTATVEVPILISNQFIIPRVELVEFDAKRLIQRIADETKKSGDEMAAAAWDAIRNGGIRRGQVPES
jgi:hypothetical protein